MPQSLHRDSVVKLEESFTHPSDRRTLTDIEVAARLGVSRFTVRSWRLKGVGPRFMKWVGRSATDPRTWTNTNGRLSSRRRQQITARCDQQLAWRPPRTPASTSLTGRSRREMTHGTLETRPPLLDTDGCERRLDSTAAVPAWLDARNDQLAGGCCPREGIDPGCLAGQPADTQSFDQVVCSGRRLSQGEEGYREYATIDRLRPRTAGGGQASAGRRPLVGDLLACD